jgi:hypothetical protein
MTMTMKLIGTALVAMGLAVGGAYAQQTPQVQGQQTAPGTGTSNVPGERPHVAPSTPGAAGRPTSSQPPEAQGQQTAPGTGTANVPGEPPHTTGSAPGSTRSGAPGPGATPAPGTNTGDRGSAAGTGTASPSSR